MKNTTKYTNTLITTTLPPRSPQKTNKTTNKQTQTHTTGHSVHVAPQHANPFIPLTQQSTSMAEPRSPRFPETPVTAATVLLRLQQEVQHLREQNRSLQEQNKRQQAKIEDLEQHNSIEENIRMRFLATYKRGSRSRSMTGFDWAVIRRGNSNAHHGDPQADALLCCRGMWRDDTTFAELYGLGWKRVMKLLGQYFPLRSPSIREETDKLPSRPRDTRCAKGACFNKSQS